MVEAQQVHYGDETPTDLASDIRGRVRMPPDVTPEDAVRAVMCTISQHVSADDAQEIFAALPPDVQAMVDLCQVHKDAKPARFSRDELLQRVADHLRCSMGDAEDITSAVIMAISARLPGGRAENVASRLPPDLRPLWVARRVALPTEPHPIVLRIQASAVLPDGVDGIAAFATVIGTLTRRLSRGEARHFAKGFPVDLKPLVEDYLDDRGEHAARFDHEEYLALVAQELDTDDIDEAEDVARAVFTAVQDYLRTDVYEHVLRQLPMRLQELWAV
jgi:uncharacterized protein (DUF2267 family)